MDFGFSPEDEAFRHDLRDFLESHPAGRSPRDRACRLTWQRQYQATLADAGYAAPAWPTEWGGMDLPLTQQLIYHEEMTLARAPGPPTPNVNIVGPTIILHGTQAQKERYLRPMIRAEELWCQGFSEPDSGSDLASLRTRADRDGDEYVVNGQKIWTSGGPVADWIFALVRTGTPESRQHGISYLLIDLKTPGVTVKPIRDMSDRKHFSEVFFDDVRVPVQNRVGDENGGWAIARTSLGHERSTAFVAAQHRYRRIVDELADLARDIGVIRDPLIRQKLARAEIDVRLLGLNGLRVLSDVLRTGEPGPASSVTRLFHGEFERRLHEVALDVIGARALLGASDPRSVQNGRWVWGFLRTRASTIGAGTAEIQRNTIAERVLGLPHEPTTGHES